MNMSKFTAFLGYIKAVFMFACLLFPLCVSAQYVRTSYFMDGAQYRMQLNPALAPERGYIHIPAIGNSSAMIRSNALNVSDIFDLIKNAGDDDYYTTDKFYNRLKDQNKAMATMGSDLFAVGTWHGNSFMSFNISLRADGNLSVARELFTFMRDMKGMNTNDYSDYTRLIGGNRLGLNLYTEIGFGYSRILNDRLTIGGRIKGLLGLGNVDFKLKKAVINTRLQGIDPNIDWTTAGPDELLDATGTATIDVDADLVTSFHGLDLVTNSDGYIDDVKFKMSRMGISGLGAAIDAGLAYNVTPEFTISAAVTDLGFIRWTKGSTKVAHANTEDLNFDAENPGDILRFTTVVGTGEALNLDMARLTIDDQGAKARTTSIASTMSLGGEYRVLDDKVRLGALFTSHFARLENESELTFSAGYHASSLVDLALSYSPIMCGGKSLGIAVKAGPLFIGTDYLYMGNNSRCLNAQVGLSIPLGQREE